MKSRFQTTVKQTPFFLQLLNRNLSLHPQPITLGSQHLRLKPPPPLPAFSLVLFGLVHSLSPPGTQQHHRRNAVRERPLFIEQPLQLLIPLGIRIRLDGGDVLRWMFPATAPPWEVQDSRSRRRRRVPLGSSYRCHLSLSLSLSRFSGASPLSSRGVLAGVVFSACASLSVWVFSVREGGGRFERQGVCTVRWRICGGQ